MPIALKEGIQNLLEDVARGNLVEEVHAGLQLQHIYVAAHDGVYVAPVLMGEQSLAHLAQACTKQGMLPIGACLVDTVQTVELGVVTVTQSLLLGKVVKVPDILFHGRHAAHGVNGIALALQAMPLPQDGAKVVQGSPGGTAMVKAAGIGTEHEYLVASQAGDVLGGYITSRLLVYAKSNIVQMARYSPVYLSISCHNGYL